MITKNHDACDTVLVPRKGNSYLLLEYSNLKNSKTLKYEALPMVSKLKKIFLAFAAASLPMVTCQSTQAQAIEENSQLTSAISSSSKAKIALVLGGGGARGAAHVGVLKVFKEAGIPIDMVVGTSIGSVVGGLYAAGVDISEMEKKFDDASLMKAFMTVSLPVRIAVAPVMVAPRIFGIHAYDGLYRGNKFRNYVNALVPETDKNIENLKVPYAAICLDVVDGKTHRINSGNLGTAMQASTAVPGLRKPVQINDHLYVDGGVLSNVPVEHAKEMGADFIIAVNIDEKLDEVPLDHFRKAGSITRRMLKIQLNAIDQPQCQKADIVIHPNVDGISLVSRNADDGKRGIRAGEEAARKSLPQIKEKLASLGITL
jgi:NTE family protein